MTPSGSAQEPDGGHRPGWRGRGVRGRGRWTDQPRAGQQARPPASAEDRTQGLPPADARTYPWQQDPDNAPTERANRSRLPPLRPSALGPSALGPSALGPSATGGAPDGEPTEPAAGQRYGPALPRKLTVTRVIIYRTQQLAVQWARAFRRAAHADGAGKSGLAALTYAVMLKSAADATVAVALANTLFFSAATGESRTKVVLYLLITVAPFAVIAPIIGPALDKVQRGRRLALAASSLGRAILAVVMALHFNDWLLYPAALGSMVLSQSFGVLKAAVTPRVLPPEITLVKTNSRLTTFGLVAATVFGGVAAGFTTLFGSPGALWFTAAICLAGGWLCMRMPAWVEVTEGEVPASLSAHPHKPKRQPMGRHVVVALWGGGTLRMLTGFLTLFSAFVIKGVTEHSPSRQLLLLGVIGASAGVGNFLGNVVGGRLSIGQPHRVVLACLGGALVMTAVAAAIPGVPTTAVLAMVAATASALAKVSLDAVVQRDMPEESRASAFGRSETILQLGWVFGGALGVLLPATFWLGFTVLSALLALGLTQAVMFDLGKSLVPGLGGDRPSRFARFGARTSSAAGAPPPEADPGRRSATRPLSTDHLANPLPREPGVPGHGPPR